MATPPRRRAVAAFVLAVAGVIVAAMAVDLAAGTYRFTPVALIGAVVAVAAAYLTATRRRGR